MAFTLRVEGFRHGEPIPKVHTCEGSDLSPELNWSGEPAHTQSFALIVDDPDAPMGTWNHWLVWDIPAATHRIPEGGSAGVSGMSDFGRTGYGGPCPPKGHGPHRYFFKLYAVDVPKLGIDANAKRADLDKALRTHVAAEVSYMGRYERR